MKVQDNSLNLGQVLLNQTNTDDGRFCDVILQVENKDFHAHRSVLASRCEYFNTMFSVNMKEKHDKVITMQGITPNVFNEVLNWIYIGEATITADNVINLYRACSMMQINQLLDHVKKFLVENIDDLVLNNQDFDLKLDEIKEIMESNQIYNFNTFEFILKWIDQNVEERKTIFPDLFQLVRLDLVSSDYLYNVISKNKVFKQFSECRDRLEAVMYSRIMNDVKVKSSPLFSPSQNQTSGLLAALSTSNEYTDVIDIERQSQTRYYKCLSGLIENNLDSYHGIALKYPFVALCGCSSNCISFMVRKIVMFDGSKWYKMPPLNRFRNGFVITFFGSDLFVFGGEYFGVSDNGEMLTDVLNCDKISQISCDPKVKWKVFDLGLNPRSYLAAQTVDNKIYLIGGFTYKDGFDRLKGFDWNDDNRVPCADTTIYYPRTNSSIEGNEMNKARAVFACATLDSTIYVCGGIGIDGSNLSCVEYLDTTTNVWTSVTPEDSPVAGSMFSGCFVNEKLYFKNLKEVFVYDPESKSITRVCEIDLISDKDRTVIIPFDERRLQHLLMQ